MSLDAAGHQPEARRLLDSALVRRVLACMIIVIMIAISIWILTYVLFL
ncbi:protein RL9A [Human betaherpesvirus 5]|uniref:Protein RL9A n=3 Tax=Human cytomegalovirus TaxID=10359 RepID=J7HDB9_HCMVA|nr:protein RL9A [Human betaherpesvirus 5]ACV65920.1 protein RL9A [Human betaherpesvirus 5]AFP95434.1 protein RL9A [Human betaherpesvirus 5]AFP95499.1 protein RL9A [Human betaherpesvirus 5]AFP95503.1 protein RL9A [Human betaherpesvirus 5]